MKNSDSILRKIMVFLGMEIKLEQMKLVDGVTVLEADSFEKDSEVFIVAEDEQKIPLPIGDYEMEDGNMLTVEVEGMIASYSPKKEDEEKPMAEEELESEGSAPTQSKAQAVPRSIMEVTSKEYKFSQEDMDAKDSKIAELEAKILELGKTEEISEEEKDKIELENIKPIVHNPEPSKVKTLSDAPVAKTHLERIFEQVYK